MGAAQWQLGERPDQALLILAEVISRTRVSMTERKISSGFVRACSAAPSTLAQGEPAAASVFDVLYARQTNPPKTHSVPGLLKDAHRMAPFVALSTHSTALWHDASILFSTS